MGAAVTWREPWVGGGRARSRAEVAARRGAGSSAPGPRRHGARAGCDHRQVTSLLARGWGQRPGRRCRPGSAPGGSGSRCWQTCEGARAPSRRGPACGEAGEALPLPGAAARCWLRQGVGLAVGSRRWGEQGWGRAAAGSGARWALRRFGSLERAASRQCWPALRFFGKNKQPQTSKQTNIHSISTRRKSSFRPERLLPSLTAMCSVQEEQRNPGRALSCLPATPRNSRVSPGRSRSNACVPQDTAEFLTCVGMHCSLARS